ncbi:MAG: hypothetical protein JNJ48_03930 [Phycisphaerae bacterium]|nr:hypothetical protein [Phycisphaerae bacterium]
MTLRWAVILALVLAPICWRNGPVGCSGEAIAAVQPDSCCCEGVDECPCIGHAPDRAPPTPAPAKPTNPSDDAWRAMPTADAGWWLPGTARPCSIGLARAAGASEPTLRRLARLCVWRT